MDRRTRRLYPGRDAIAGLPALRDEHAARLDRMPDPLCEGAAAAALQASANLDPGGLSAIEPPRGYGRD